MARDGEDSVRDAALVARPIAGASALTTVSGQIALNSDETGPHLIEVVVPGRMLSLDCEEIVENSRAIRRGKADARRFLRIEPLSVDLTEGPALVVLRSGNADPRVLAQLDLPGAGIARYRRLLDLELQQGIVRHHTARRSARLDRAFYALPEAPDNPDWLESWIILNCLRHTRPARTHAMIGALRDLRTAENRPEAFAGFMRLVTETHGLQPPNGHSYDASLGKRDRDALWQGITDIMAMLKGMGLTVFLNSGTLLGAVREGDLLGHDDDIDLAVLIAGRTQEEAAHAWIDLRQRLDAKGLVSDKSNRSGFGIIKLPRIEGVLVDLFPAWIDTSGDLHVYPYACGGLKRTDLLPLKAGPRPGTRIPARAERLLEMNYGPGWREPDPLFRFDWNTASARFRPFMTVLRTTHEIETAG